MIPHQVWVNRLGLALFVFLMFLVAQPAVYSQPHQPEEEELLPIVHPSEKASLLAPADVSVLPKGPIYGGMEHSVIAYEGFLNNWEIVLTQQDDTYINLTNHPASDISPRLTKGGGRVVFASNRDGDYELYTMRTNGTELRQLTFNQANDINPSWSPSEQQIVFQSSVDGQAEIYIINIDGTGLTRLTADADFDGFPAWSPDGTQIAFSSRRTGGYRIYLLTLATGELRQVTTYPYSAYPVWSTDGTHIAFSSDPNQDGWFDLSWVNIVQNVEGMVVPAPEGADIYPSAWGPTGEGLLYVSVQYFFHNGRWYVHNLMHNFWNMVTNSFYLANIQPFHTGFVDWAKADITPPQTFVNPLPVWSKADSHTIRWSGTDLLDSASYLTSGVHMFDVQFKNDYTNGWQTWQSQVQYQALEITADKGTLTYFRSRAYDYAGNIEEWGEAEATTTFYSWLLNTELTDNRGRPLNNPVLGISPQPITSEAVRTGQLKSYLQEMWEHSVTFTRPGYGQWAESLIYDESLFTAYMPPQDNLILNGGFEGEASLEWQQNGNLPNSFATKSHTGQQAAAAGELCVGDCFGSSEFIPGTELYYGSEQYVLDDGQGNLYFFLVDQNSNNSIYYTIRNTAGVWSPVELLLSNQENPVDAVTYVDSQGTIHVFYGESDYAGQAIYYFQKPRQGDFSDPIVVTTEFGHVFDVERDAHNLFHLVVQKERYSPTYEADKYYLIQLPFGGWHKELIPGPMVNMALMSDGTALFFKKFANDHLRAPSYLLRHPHGSWGRLRDIPIVEPNEWVADLKKSKTEDKLFVFINSYRGDSRLLVYDSTIGWQGQTMPLPVNVIGQSFDIDSKGNIYFLAFDDTDRNHLLYQYQPGQGWLDPLFFDGEMLSSRAIIHVDSFDVPHLLIRFWALEGADYHQLTPAATAETAEWSQTITIPVTMTNPTLSFMYQTVRDVPGDETGLQVEISNGLTPTVQLLPPAVGWELAWLDVSQWAGQQVTVTFQLNQATDAPQMELYLDDVSLGSALPDVWVGLESNVGALPGETVVYHLNYGNLSGVTAVSPTITLTLPAPLTFISATVPPLTSTNSVMVWSTADLPAQSTGETIVITAVLTNTAAVGDTFTGLVEIAVPEEEVEQVNNQLQLRLFIGRYQFLPLIVRD